MINRYTTQEKFHMKIFKSDVSVYNTHPHFRPDFRRKNCVLYAENYGTFSIELNHIYFLSKCDSISN